MKKCFLALLCLSSSLLSAQNRQISGYVEDAESGERLIGVNVYLPGSSIGAISNRYGYYVLSLPPGDYDLQVSFLGYRTESVRLALRDSSLSRDFQLQAVSDSLSEVAVTAKRSRAQEVQMSRTELSEGDIRKIPMLLGEVDIIRAIQLLPGVQSGNEGTTGFYVRGGSPDQNLILLDGVPVYNASHLFGFFSVFNADAIQNVSLTTGGFPARFGGRLSSVLEIDLKEGNRKEFHGQGSLGLIASKLTLEGPLFSEKTSFIISGRRTYWDLLARPFLPEDLDFGYYFYDVNAKINHVFSRRDRLFASYYTGQDRFFNRQEYSDPFSGSGSDGFDEQNLQWGNHTAALRWNHLFNPRLFSNLTATFSQYAFSVGFESLSRESGIEERAGYEYLSRIRDLGLRYDLEHSLNNHHQLRYGISYTYHHFTPGVAQFRENFSGEQLDSVLELSDPIFAHDFFAYAEDEWQINQRLKANFGLHYSFYDADGAFYQSLQPRLALRYLYRDNWSFKASYALMNQYVHLLSNAGIGLPTDLWVSTTELVKPQFSQQWALGSTYTWNRGTWEVSGEVYYKKMENLIEYEEGASFFSTNDWEDNVETDGYGEAYGLELLLRKNKGRTTGWIGYTLARSQRQFDELNRGNWFPFRYDRRHDVSVVLNHGFSDRFDLGFTWVYGSGYTFTAPVAETRLPFNPNTPFFGGNNYTIYSDRNALRMPGYHRLDLGLNFHKKTKWGERTWNISFYNAYNRRNPFFLYLNENFNGETEVRQVSLFPIIPAVAYIFKF